MEQFEQCFSKEHFCEIILKLELALEEMLFYEFSIFSSGGHFVQRSRTILAIFDKLHQRIIRMKLFLNGPIGLGEDVVLRVFLFLALAAILFSGAEPF